MKKILLILTTAVLLTGCVASEGKTPTKFGVPRKQSPDWVYIRTSGSIAFYYDRDTRVIYARSQHGGLVMLANADGTPRLYRK